MATITTTKLVGHLQTGDKLNVNGEPATVGELQRYYNGIVQRVEFLLHGEGWTSAVDVEAGDAVWLWTGADLDAEEDADAEALTRRI